MDCRPLARDWSLSESSNGGCVYMIMMIPVVMMATMMNIMFMQSKHQEVPFRVVRSVSSGPPSF